MRDPQQDEIARLKHGVPCDSCGGDAWEPSPGDARCYGCGLVVCQACATVFAHFADGHHGVGDPVARVRDLLAKAGLLKRIDEELSKENEE